MQKISLGNHPINMKYNVDLTKTMCTKKSIMNCGIQSLQSPGINFLADLCHIVQDPLTKKMSCVPNPNFRVILQINAAITNPGLLNPLTNLHGATV